MCWEQCLKSLMVPHILTCKSFIDFLIQFILLQLQLIIFLKPAMLRNHRETFYVIVLCVQHISYLHASYINSSLRKTYFSLAFIRCVYDNAFLLFTTQWAKTWKKVHFGRTMHCLPQRLKSIFIEIFSSGGSSKEILSEEIFFSKHWF